jgi:Sulfotransferase domain
MNDQTLPNLIIAGVNKAGTTSLFSYLAQHPQIGASAVKETCHFLPLRYGEPMPGVEAYHAQFTHIAQMPVRMESTPGYFFGGRRLIDGLQAAVGEDLKIVLIFREPVERLVSFFNFKKSTLELPADMSLTDYVQRCRTISMDDLRKRENNPWFGLEGGKYADYLPPWVETFGNRLRVVFSDDLRADPRGVLRELCVFASVDPQPVDQIELTLENKGTGYRNAGAQRLALTLNRAGETFWRSHPRIKRTLRRAYYALNGKPIEADDDGELIQELQRFYKPCNEAFADQLRGRGDARLPDWLTPPAVGEAT